MVERNSLIVRAERRSQVPEDAQWLIAERPRQAVFTRNLMLGDNLDTESIKATYDGGVLTLRVPIAERAQPRRIEVTGGSQPIPVKGGPAADVAANPATDATAGTPAAG